MDGRSRATAARRQQDPPRRSSGAEAAVRGLHQVRPRAEAAVPTDPGVAREHAASDAQDHEERLRAQHEPAAARLRRLPLVLVRVAQDAGQLPIQYRYKLPGVLWVSYFNHHTRIKLFWFQTLVLDIFALTLVTLLKFLFLK